MQPRRCVHGLFFATIKLGASKGCSLSYLNFIFGRAQCPLFFFLAKHVQRCCNNLAPGSSIRCPNLALAMKSAWSVRGNLNGGVLSDCYAAKKFAISQIKRLPWNPEILGFNCHIMEVKVTCNKRKISFTFVVDCIDFLNNPDSLHPGVFYVWCRDSFDDLERKRRSVPTPQPENNY